MSNLDSFLNAVKANLPDTKVDYPTIPTFVNEAQNVVDVFQENLLKAGASFYRVNDIAEAQGIAQKIYPDAKVICSATAEWNGNKTITDQTVPQEMEDVDVAIVRSHLGVAEMGMVWLTEADLKVNSLGFLCQNIIVLLDPKDITANMHTAYQKVNLDKDPYGCFVMGPSATADIGAVLVHGAQGPRSLVVMLLQAH